MLQDNGHEYGYEYAYELYLADDLTAVPSDSINRSTGPGTRPPVDEHWQSPFIGWTAEQCAEALAGAQPKNIGLSRDRFVLLGPRIGLAETVICLVWTEKDRNEMIKDYEADQDVETMDEDEREEFLEFQTDILDLIDGLGVKQKRMAQEETATYIWQTSTVQFLRHYTGREPAGGPGRDSWWFANVMEQWRHDWILGMCLQWQATRGSVPVMDAESQVPLEIQETYAARVKKIVEEPVKLQYPDSRALLLCCLLNQVGSEHSHAARRHSTTRGTLSLATLGEIRHQSFNSALASVNGFPCFIRD